MARPILRRVLFGIPTVLVVSALTFILIALIPGDPASVLLGATASQEQREALRTGLGLDQPLYAQYWDWLTGAVRGDFGRSLFSKQAVSDTLVSRIGVTASITMIAFAFTVLIGITGGLLSARRKAFVSKLSDVVSLVGLAVPSVWLGLVLVEMFAVRWSVFPATGYTAPSTSVTEWLRSLILPALTLAAPASALVAKLTRDAMLSSLAQPFVPVLRANGATERTIFFKHALKNALPQIVTTLGIVIVGLVGATVLVETVFVLPGLGTLATTATTQKDLPTIEGVTVTYVLMVLMITILIDILHTVVSPRSRLGAR
jgi:peptide/nickel transport system permease protein